MTIETDIVDALKGDMDLAALIADRVYPDTIAQGAPMPAVAYTEITGQREQHLQGSCDLFNGRYQFDCYALTALQAGAVREVLCAALEAATAFSVVQGIRTGGFETDTKRYRRMVEFSIWRNDVAGSP